MTVVIAESLESMMSLSYFSKEPATVESALAEKDTWLSESNDYDKRNYDDPNHPTRN